MAFSRTQLSLRPPGLLIGIGVLETTQLQPQPHLESRSSRISLWPVTDFCSSGGLGLYSIPKALVQEAGTDLLAPHQEKGAV